MVSRSRPKPEVVIASARNNVSARVWLTFFGLGAPENIGIAVEISQFVDPIRNYFYFRFCFYGDRYLSVSGVGHTSFVLGVPENYIGI